jgi:Fe-S cluster assembly scaffold protein SufB
MTSGMGHYSLHFITESGESIVRILLLANNNQHIQSTVHSTLSASNTLTDLHILSFAGENGVIMLNGIVEIVSEIQKVSGHILEENIFLGSR